MNEEVEVWKRHKCGLLVSSWGRVLTPRKHIHYGNKASKNYLIVRYGTKVYRVSRLICEAFKDNPDNLPTVDHINRDRSDNRACNLRWADYSTQNRNRDIDYYSVAAKIAENKLSKKTS